MGGEREGDENPELPLLLSFALSNNLVAICKIFGKCNILLSCETKVINSVMSLLKFSVLYVLGSAYNLLN